MKKNTKWLVTLLLLSIMQTLTYAAVYEDKNGCYSYIDDNIFSKDYDGMDRVVSWSGNCVKDEKGVLRAEGFGEQIITYHYYFTFRNRKEGDEIVGIFNGEMKDGVPIKGKMFYPITGNYDEGSCRNGYCIKKRKDKTIEGEFKSWKLNGFAKITYADGRIETGLYQEDNLITSCTDEKDCKKKKAEIDKKANDEAKKFANLGKCEAGETVYHREVWNATTSSGNFLADAFLGASIKESFIIEFEGVVKGFTGKKVEVYLQDYSVKQTKGGGILQPATGVKSSVTEYADKRIGKSHFFDKARCGN
jgi:hypothetical protein